MLPPPPSNIEGATRSYLFTLLNNLERMFRARSGDVPVQALKLASPNGTVYTVTVGDDGTLTVTEA